MKKAVTITLKMSEMIYDIQNKTFLTGRSASSGENYSHVANMQANDDEENADQILRSITMAYGILTNRFSEYMEGSQLTGDNSLLPGSSDLTLSLEMPSNFNSNVAKTIGEAAHQFIVATAIADWFSITAKGETADYTGVAEASLKVIEEALCKRVRPTRQSE